ncbi:MULTISPECIES: cytochrome P450 [Sorangium]|uniref:Cytochrome P450 n=1 Tax=Sorangium cellulosum TaxID=56 RepID=A0A4P2R5D9_SORCE|nr:MULTISPECIES: cytochrome P450 [Sorangium]AUX38006.1 cytochrome P450 [Sorangium cellulosum]WCQ97294.1 Cytochrome P450 [Sorangium sp. Soce836]
MTRLNLFAPDVRENPYPFYAALRRESPVCQVDPNGMWVVTRYDDVVAALKDTQVFSSAGLRLASEPPYLRRHNPLSRSLLMADPPRHGQLRSLINRAFTASTVASLEPLMRSTAERLADELVERRTVEFISDFALRAQVSVLAQLLGLDPSLKQHFKRWATDIVGVSGVSPEDRARLDEVRGSLDEMERYAQALLAKRRSQLEDDWLSDLLRARLDNNELTDDDLIGFIFLFLVAGLETTVTLMTQVVLTLARRPEWMDRLRDEPALIAPFIEEVLRTEPPIHATIRLTLAETELRGVRLPAQSAVLLLVGSGLRDEARFPDPDRFDPERRVQANLAFGHGAHFCVGAPLARTQARVVLEELLRKVRRFELRTERLDWNMSLNTRCPLELPVEAVSRPWAQCA